MVAGRREGGRAFLGDGEELPVRMVPGVAGLVVRRRRQGAVGLALAPVRLALQVGAVATGAVFPVEAFALGQVLFERRVAPPIVVLLSEQ